MKTCQTASEQLVPTSLNLSCLIPLTCYTTCPSLQHLHCFMDVPKRSLNSLHHPYLTYMDFACLGFSSRLKPSRAGRLANSALVLFGACWINCVGFRWPSFRPTPCPGSSRASSTSLSFVLPLLALSQYASVQLRLAGLAMSPANTATICHSCPLLS